MFDVEGDVADWTHRELDRLAGFIPGGEAGNYLKIAVYHYSTSNPASRAVRRTAAMMRLPRRSGRPSQ
jgi:hypothetical protein